MTRDELDILKSLIRSSTWSRPMDVGGFDGSNHSRILAKLAKAGLAERRPRGTLHNTLIAACTPKGKKVRAVSWEYRATSMGLIETLNNAPAPFVEVLTAFKDEDISDVACIARTWHADIADVVHVEYDYPYFTVSMIVPGDTHLIELPDSDTVHVISVIRTMLEAVAPCDNCEETYSKRSMTEVNDNKLWCSECVAKGEEVDAD